MMAALDNMTGGEKIALVSMIGFFIVLGLLAIFGSGCAYHGDVNFGNGNNVFSNKSTTEAGDGGQTNSITGGGAQVVFEPKEGPTD